ncbi:TonB-dependent receptor [Pontibacter locisalis]|uniref:TonB-dependent receptor n=1 Tax=Pontibacter locisalis TaxID=1719035 RepID=A0ABW5IIJ6_9BACT
MAIGFQPLQAQFMPDSMPEAPDEQDCGLTISGKVLDHDSRVPLVGATVSIPKLQRATVADEYGNYHFHHLCQGSYTLKVTYLGYEEETFSVKITSSTVRDLQLHVDSRQLSQVEVIGNRLSEEAQSSGTISGRELEATRGLSLGESIKNISGMSTIQTGPTISKPVIHGLHSNRILILNNGVRHEGQQWGAEHAPEIDPFAASEIKVVKGAAGVRYGADAIGGVVLVEPAPLRDCVGVNGELNLLGTTNNRQGAVSATVDGKAAKLPALSWRLQGTLKRAGNARTADYYLQNTGFSEANFSGALGYKKENFGAEVFYSQFNTRLGILKAAHIGNLTDLYNAIARDRPEQTSYDFSYTIERPFQDVTHHLLKTKAYLNTGDAGKLEFVYGFQRNIREEYDAHRASGTNPELTLDITTHTTETVWEHAPLGNFSGSAGISTIYQNNIYSGRYFIPYFRNFTAGAFIIEKWRKDKLQLEGGVRYDFKKLNITKRERNADIIRPEYNFNNISGTLGALYDVGYHLTFGLSATSAWRAPGANELFSDGVHHGSASYERGDRNLNAEQAYNFEASVNYYGNQRLNGKLSLYNNFINDYIYLAPVQPATLTIRGAFPTFEYKQADAVFKGVDLDLEYRFTPNLYLESRTSIVRATNKDLDDHLVGVPADRYNNMLRFEPGTIGNIKSLTDTYVALGGTYVAEQTRVPTKAEQDYMAPPAGAFLLNMELGTTVHFGKQPVEFGITGNNLLNTSYRDYLNRFRYFADDIGRMLLFRVKVPLSLGGNK